MAREKVLTDEDLEDLLDRKEEFEENLSELNHKLKDSEKNLKSSTIEVKKAFGTIKPLILKKKKLELVKNLSVSLELLNSNSLYQELTN